MRIAVHAAWAVRCHGTVGAREVNDAIGKIALAFEASQHRRDKWGQSPIDFGRSSRFKSAFSLGRARVKSSEFIDNAGETLTQLTEAVTALSLGLDVERHARFRSLTPVVPRMDGRSDP